MKPSLKVTSDYTANFNRIVAEFKKEAVLVGVPADAPARFEIKKGRVVASETTNAALFAIHNLGSPVRNIPARPVMDIAIRSEQDQVSDWFRLAVIDAFKPGLMKTIKAYYGKVGRRLARTMKRVINQQEGIEPVTDSTLSARHRNGISGNKALLATTQMRDSITYIVPGGE